MRSSIASFAVSVALFAVVSASAHAQNYPSGYIKGNSDWWSILNESFRTPVRSPENRSFASSNLEIAGQSFHEGDFFDLGNNPFGRITASLGKTRITERGDASTGRAQICYTSKSRPGTTYLIFETGETDLTFYLFSQGASWKGSDRCARSPFVSRSLTTGSGLRLGMTASQVEAILGKPTASIQGRLIYWGTTHRKTSQSVLNRLRKQNPKMSSAEFQKDFSQYDLTIYIEARFSAGKMTYLVVSEDMT